MSKTVETQQLHVKQTQVLEMQPPTPRLFIETLNAYQQTAALKAALELDLFTKLAQECSTADALAERCGASVRGMRVLSDYLVGLG